MRTEHGPRRPRRAWALGLLALALLPGAARAANFSVTNTADTGAGSLRQAIAAAGASTDPADVITFDPAAFGATAQTITLTSGELAGGVTGKTLTIVGPGRSRLAVSGGGASRVLEVTAGTVNASGMTLMNGATTTAGGGVLVDTGATLTLANVAVQNSTVTGAFGGGVYSSGALTMTDCVVSGNTSTEEGGGVFSTGGTLTLTRCAVVGNTGGLYSGGVGTDSDGAATLTNCTLANNVSSGNSGAGLDNYGNGGSTLVSCTLTGNRSPGAGGILNEGGSTLTLQGTIVAANTTTGTGGPDFENAGTLTDNGSNLVGDNTGGGTFTDAHDQVGTAATPINPGLGPVQDNGGPSPTAALLRSSPAIDGDFSANAPATDQRGLGRPQGVRADIGAFELDTVPPVTTASLSGPSFANGFYRGPVTVTLNVQDATAPFSTFVSVDSGPARAYTGPFTVTGDFAHFVAFYSVDGAGNFENPAKSVSFSIDSTPPVTTITSRAVQGGQEVTLTDRDNFSGPGGTFFRVDGGPQQTYTAPFIVGSPGSHTVTAYSIDRALNAEPSAKSLTFTVTPPPAPVTSVALSGPSYFNGFWRGPVTVTLSASSGPGGPGGNNSPPPPISTFVSVDSGPLRAYTGPFSVSGDFAHLVSFFSASANGATENPAKAITFSIDTTPPVTTLTSRAVAGGREVTLKNTDNFSGPGGTFYRVDSGPQQTYTAPFVVPGSGPHLVTAYSIDRAANAEPTAKSLTFTNP